MFVDFISVQKAFLIDLSIGRERERILFRSLSD